MSCSWVVFPSHVRLSSGNLAAWSLVQKLKSKGVLGVINLRLQNDALLMKHLHKFYNKYNIPWVQLIWFKYYTRKVPHSSREVGSFWWKDVLRLSTLFRGIARCKVGDGTTVTFGEELWSKDILANQFPVLYSFAKNANSLVQDIVLVDDLDSLFHLPLSLPAFRDARLAMGMILMLGFSFGVTKYILPGDTINLSISICNHLQFSR